MEPSTTFSTVINNGFYRTRQLDFRITYAILKNTRRRSLCWFSLISPRFNNDKNRARRRPFTSAQNSSHICGGCAVKVTERCSNRTSVSLIYFDSLWIKGAPRCYFTWHWIHFFNTHFLQSSILKHITFLQISVIYCHFFKFNIMWIKFSINIFIYIKWLSTIPICTLFWTNFKTNMHFSNLAAIKYDALVQFVQKSRRKPFPSHKMGACDNVFSTQPF